MPQPVWPARTLTDTGNEWVVAFLLKDAYVERKPVQGTKELSSGMRVIVAASEVCENDTSWDGQRAWETIVGG